MREQRRTARPAGCPSANFAARWNWYVEDFSSCLRQDFTQFLRSLAKFLRLRADPPVAVRQHASAYVPLQLLKEAEEKIKRLDAEILLAHLLGISRTELYIYNDEPSNEVAARFNNLVNERATGRPLQYILGKAEFMGLELKVTEDVFIPRPETELLVETAIKIVKNILNADTRKSNADKRRFICENPRAICGNLRSKVCLLDLGTGSGAIAIALTKFIPDCKILTSDVSRRALGVAMENARANLVDKRIAFIASDLFEKLPRVQFDLIVSNPPYVASYEFEGLPKEIGFEPRVALDGGHDGLDIYRRLIKDAPGFLKKGGFLLLEIGTGQDAVVGRTFAGSGFENRAFLRDYNNINRVAVAQWTR